MTSGEMITEFAVNTYEPVPDKPGYQRVKETAKVADLLTAINEHLSKAGIVPDEYDFGVGYFRQNTEKRIPDPGAYRWLIAFAVEGGSEGYYVHVGAMMREDHTADMYTVTRQFDDYGCAKCNTADNAFAVAREVQRFLCAAAWN